MAHRGLLAVKPSCSCCSRELTFKTTPSVSRGSSRRLVSHSLIYESTSWMLLHFRYDGETLNFHASNCFIASSCEVMSTSSPMRLYTKQFNFRLATSAESCIFNVPEAVFRALAYRSSPMSSRSLFNCSKPCLERKTSPRTSKESGRFLVLMWRGMLRIVLTLAVTSSPCTPSPRVTPRTR